MNEDVYECEECSAQPGAPVLCQRCARACRHAGSAWRGMRPNVKAAGEVWGVWAIPSIRDGCVAQWTGDATGTTREECEAYCLRWNAAQISWRFEARPRAVVAPRPVETPTKSPVESLAEALHAEVNRERIGVIVRDRPGDETYAVAERRVHAIMWQREPTAVRERYAERAVGLLAWMGGGK